MGSKSSFSTINFTLIALVIFNSIVEILVADQVSYDLGAPGSVQPNILAVAITFFIARYIMKVILKKAPSLKFQIPITIYVWYLIVLLKYILIVYLLDQPWVLINYPEWITYVLFGVTLLLFFGLSDYVEQLSKSNESYNESSDDNQSIVDKFFSLFNNKSSDKISGWVDTLSVGFGPHDMEDFADDKFNDIIHKNLKKVNLNGFKNYEAFKNIFNILDEKCGYKNYTWRTAFKADLKYFCFNISLALCETKKEQKEMWNELYEVLEDFKIDFDDLENLKKKVSEYQDSKEFATTLKMNYMAGSFIGNKII